MRSSKPVTRPKAVIADDVAAVAVVGVVMVVLRVRVRVRVPVPATPAAQPIANHMPHATTIMMITMTTCTMICTTMHMNHQPSPANETTLPKTTRWTQRWKARFTASFPRGKKPSASW